ncbi:SurA N-terminal domain-containing protein [Maridesulfovibrio hydrothermalis]|uniref:SurA domain protein n=1 Tax=Maridesulfovibrio hydrothermalis AM13 = DSM 14728 TaxID=1121451 RepID=L0REA4_9BACT|nr:SurA N-terminal domain-containing protein [Maridesulfovibrio hydrothermalis]CCO24537.1 SurA domain protein [Maridesulfovibrio hydrothermalis AM13 = DSM 14728]
MGDFQLKRTIAGILIAMICLSASFASAGEKVVDGIVAVVNGDIVTMYELRSKMAPIMKQFNSESITAVEAEQIKKIRKQILERMINEMIIDQEAKKLGVNVSQQDIDNEVKRIKESSKLSDEEFERQLTLQKTNLKDFKAKIGQDIRKHRLLSYKIKNKVVVTDEEIKAAWNSTRTAEEKKAKSVHLKLILFPADASADSVREQIISGEISFEEAADKYTVGPGGGSGGDLGVLDWGDLATTWHDALSGLEPGGVSAPFEVQSSKALLKLDSFVSTEEASFEDSKDEIYEKLYSKKQDDLFADYMKKLKENAVIEFK